MGRGNGRPGPVGAEEYYVSGNTRVAVADEAQVVGDLVGSVAASLGIEFHDDDPLPITPREVNSSVGAGDVDSPFERHGHAVLADEPLRLSDRLLERVTPERREEDPALGCRR